MSLLLPFLLPTSLGVQGQSLLFLRKKEMAFTVLCALPPPNSQPLPTFTSETRDLLSHLPLLILSGTHPYLIHPLCYWPQSCVCLQLYVYDFPRKHSCLNREAFFLVFTKRFSRIHTWYLFFLFNSENTRNTIRRELPQLPPLPINVCLCSHPTSFPSVSAEKESLLVSGIIRAAWTLKSSRDRVPSHPFYSRPSTPLLQGLCPFYPTNEYTQVSPFLT